MFRGRFAIYVRTGTLYYMIENFGDKKPWWIGTQNVFGRKNIGRLCIYTEGNQGTTKGWWIKLQQIDQLSPNSPNFFTIQYLDTCD